MVLCLKKTFYWDFLCIIISHIVATVPQFFHSSRDNRKATLSHSFYALNRLKFSLLSWFVMYTNISVLPINLTFVCNFLRVVYLSTMSMECREGIFHLFMCYIVMLNVIMMKFILLILCHIVCSVSFSLWILTNPFAVIWCRKSIIRNITVCL